MHDQPRKSVTVNGRTYSWPSTPLIVICCDGSEPDYMELALAQGLMPNLASIIAKGENFRGHSVIPSFTNPNNLSIVTGCPPAVHGICGNFFYNRESGEEIMMNDPKFLRAPTILSRFHMAGAKVAVVTAKDKLRLLLGNGLSFDEGRAVCLSAEKADQCTLSANGIENVVASVGMPVPEVYSLELSEFVFAAGVMLMNAMRPDLMYLSTTDYIQHKYAPGTDGANTFYIMMDKYLGKLDKTGAIIVLTADHGMKAKYLPDGQPDVIYLQDLFDDLIGRGNARVILPITDPYVRHHGALGSFATAYLNEPADKENIIERLRRISGIDAVYDSDEGCARFELPKDRMGDIIIVSRNTKVLGTSADRHDLAALTDPLRSHGGLTEQEIPIIVNRHTHDLPAKLRNFDAFAIGLNHIASDAAAVVEDPAIAK